MIDEAARLVATEFQARAAATGQERSPIVVRHVDVTRREVDSVERSCRPEEWLHAGRMHSLTYCSAVETAVRQHTETERDLLRDC